MYGENVGIEGVVCPSDLNLNKGHTCCYLNVRSIFPKIQDMAYLLEESECEILIVGETWLNKSITENMLHMRGYYQLRNDRTSASGKQRGGGLLMYVKHGVVVKKLDALSICTPNTETIVSQLYLKGVKEVYIIGCYRPPDGNVDQFLIELETVILNLSDRINIEILILGDMNINLSKPREPNVRKYKDFLKRHGLSNIISYDTHVNANNVGSKIDHILTSDPNLYVQRGICPLDISDYYMIYCARKKFKVKTNKIRMWARKYKNLDEDLLSRDIEIHD